MLITKDLGITAPGKKDNKLGLITALNEFLIDETSQGHNVAVIIDEALEIAKKYSDEDAPRFINGVLDGILHSRMEGRVIKT